MTTRELPKSTWAPTLEAIACRKAFQPVQVRIEDPTLGSQPLTHDLPLVGISFEEKGSQPDAVEITVAQCDGKENFTHVIAHPEHIFVQESERGEVQGLDIEDTAHVKTLIFFGPNAPTA